MAITKINTDQSHRNEFAEFFSTYIRTINVQAYQSDHILQRCKVTYFDTESKAEKFHVGDVRPYAFVRNVGHPRLETSEVKKRKWPFSRNQNFVKCSAC